MTTDDPGRHRSRSPLTDRPPRRRPRHRDRRPPDASTAAAGSAGPSCMLAAPGTGRRPSRRRRRRHGPDRRRRRRRSSTRRSRRTSRRSPSSTPTRRSSRKKIDSIHTMGDKEIRESADVSNRMLDRPVRAMGTGVFDKTRRSRDRWSSCAGPSRTSTRRGRGRSRRSELFGLIPFGDHLRDYFAKYQSAQSTSTRS